MSSGLLAGAGRAWGDGGQAAHRNQHEAQRELAAPTTRRMSNLAQLQEKISLKRRFMRWASRAMKSSSTGMILRLLRSGEPAGGAISMRTEYPPSAGKIFWASS